MAPFLLWRLLGARGEIRAVDPAPASKTRANRQKERLEVEGTDFGRIVFTSVCTSNTLCLVDLCGVLEETTEDTKRATFPHFSWYRPRTLQAA